MSCGEDMEAPFSTPCRLAFVKISGDVVRRRTPCGLNTTSLDRLVAHARSNPVLNVTLTLADIARIAEDPTSEAALAALSLDLPFPLTETDFVQREPLTGEHEDGFSLTELCRVFYRSLDEDGVERVAVSYLGSFLMTALRALLAEDGWSTQAAPLAGGLRKMIEAERVASRDCGGTLGEWAMSNAFDAAPLVAVSSLRREQVVAL